MPPRNTTKPNGTDDRLTPQQQTAVDLLVSGKTLTDTAAPLARTGSANAERRP